MSGDNTSGSRGGSLLTKKVITDISVTVGDLVYLDLGTVNTVITATDNNHVSPVIGIVLSKQSATDALILLRGPHNLSIGTGRLYLSATGGFTIVPPASGYVQDLGKSFGDGNIDFLPNPRRIKKP